MKDQGQRIAQVEKRFGVPQSTPAGETPARTSDADDDVDWPLDLNRPLDRDSVEKSLSFHD